MNGHKRKYFFILLPAVSLLSILFALSPGAGAAPSGGPSAGGMPPPASAESVGSLFSAAREGFLKGDLKNSASEVRKASALLETAQEDSIGAAWESLSTARAALDALAGAIEQKRVGSAAELDRIFGEAERALAGYYEEKASRSQSAQRAAPGKTGGGAGEGKGAMASTLRVAPKPSGTPDLGTAIINVANQNIPTVVYIEVTESKVVENPLLPLQKNPFFERFFGIPKMPRKFRQEVRGLGSGIIIDSEGHILTNNHVAGGATKMEVALADGSRHPAKLIGADPKTDLAVIKISVPAPLPYAVFGDSDKIQVGEWVVAIGAPRALEKTVTQGIVSAKHRTGITDPAGFQDFLQTDAAMNPGNSGGPLLNLYGQVIGVNAAIASSSGGFEGIGFTIPSNMAVYVAAALIAHGKVVRGWLGVAVSDVTPEIAETARLGPARGALVLSVVRGGPADRSGLRKDDLVTAYNGKDVPDSGALRNDIAETTPGQTGRITVLRSGKQEELTVRVGSEEEAANLVAASLNERLGAEVRIPTSQEADQHDLPAGVGALVVRVDPKGPLGRAGIEAADIILTLNNQPISGPEGLAGVVSLIKPGEKIPVIVLDHRTGNEYSLEIVVR